MPKAVEDTEQQKNKEKKSLKCLYLSHLQSFDLRVLLDIS
jgi:hypothetical protein